MSVLPNVDREIADASAKELAAIAHLGGVELAAIHALYHFLKRRFDALDAKVDALANGPATTHLEITSGKPKDKNV